MFGRSNILKRKPCHCPQPQEEVEEEGIVPTKKFAVVDLRQVLWESEVAKCYSSLGKDECAQEMDIEEEEEPVINLQELPDALKPTGNLEVDPLDINSASGVCTVDPPKSIQSISSIKPKPVRLHPEKPFQPVKTPTGTFTYYPPPSTVKEINSIVQNYIEKCVNCQEDPRSKHQFYVTLHSLISDALLKTQLIKTVTEADILWKKFDNWAGQAYLRLKEATKLQAIYRANDKSIQLPLGLKRKVRPNKRLSTRTRKTGNLRWKLEEKLKQIILESRKGLRGDLLARIRFYESWPSTTNLVTLDHCWNVILNRRKNYYTQEPVILEKKPRRRKKLTKRTLNIDWLMKKLINDLVDRGQDPRTTHKFHWSLYKCLLKCSSGEGGRTAKWKLCDDFARQSWEQGVRWQINKECNRHFETAKDVPYPKGWMESRSNGMLNDEEKVRGFLEDLVDKFVEEFKGTGVDVEARRRFLESYVGKVDVDEVDEGLFDSFWRRLVSETGNKLVKEKPPMEEGDGGKVGNGKRVIKPRVVFEPDVYFKCQQTPHHLLQRQKRREEEKRKERKMLREAMKKGKGVEIIEAETEVGIPLKLEEEPLGVVMKVEVKPEMIHFY